MMILEIRIKNLCSILRNSGKNNIASYFESLLDRVVFPSNESDKEEALQQIVSSGRISDLANFNLEEDELFDLVYKEAKKMKK